jgi:2-hydroxychromene-2-carboxylate isomerase/GNAT superfamily N-acetyltransferase
VPLSPTNAQGHRKAKRYPLPLGPHQAGSGPISRSRPNCATALITPIVGEARLYTHPPMARNIALYERAGRAATDPSGAPEGAMMIRRYEDRDAAAVRELFARVNRALAPPGMREAFEDYIALAIREEIGRIEDYYAGPRGGFWVAEDATGALVGTFGLESAGAGAAELRRMYVAPEARRRGIARAMLAEAERVVAGWGLSRLVLSTAEIQEAALALYRGTGYRLVREEVAGTASNKTAGAGLRRFHFEKHLPASGVDNHASAEATWFFDLVSPFAWLALPEVQALAARRPVRFRPVVFGALLKHWGQVGPAELVPKRLQTYRQVQFRAETANLPLRFPPRHPFRSLEALRLLAAEQEPSPAAVRDAFRFIWEEGRDPSEPAEFDVLAARLGNPDAGAGRDRLRRWTEEAVQAGVFGVPTLRIGTELFWGADAMPLVDAYLADPEIFARGEMGRLANLPFGVERKP